MTRRKRAVPGVALTRAAILAAEDLPRERVEVPEWGGHVHVRTMTAGERDRYDLEVIARREAGEDDAGARTADLRAWFVSFVCVDADGERLFTPEDIPALSRKSARAVDRIFEAGQRLNAMTESDVEGLAGN